MAHKSYTQDVLAATLKLAAQNGGAATAGDVSSAMLAMTRKEHKRVLNTLSDLTSQGRLRRVSQGVYGPPSQDPGADRPDKREVMWRLMRMRKRMTVADLVEMAGVSVLYAREWLLMLVNRGIAKKIQDPGMAGVWMLIDDQAPMPVDTEKSNKLKEIRRRKISGHLDAIATAVKGIADLLEEDGR